MLALSFAAVVASGDVSVQEIFGVLQRASADEPHRSSSFGHEHPLRHDDSLAAYVSTTASLLLPFSESGFEPLLNLAHRLPACLFDSVVFEVRGSEGESQIDLSMRTPRSMLHRLAADADGERSFSVPAISKLVGRAGDGCVTPNGDGSARSLRAAAATACGIQAHRSCWRWD